MLTSPPLDEPLLERRSTPTIPGVGVFEATISLAKTCIGTGVMALPFAFQQGAILSFPGLLALGVWNWITCMQLVYARAALPPPTIGAKGRAFRSTYSAVAYGAAGQVGIVLLEGSLSVMLTGVCASLQVQAAQLISASTDIDYFVAVLGTGIALIPLVLLRTLRNISFVAGGALLMVGIGLGAVTAYGFLVYGAPPADPRLLKAPHLNEFALFFGITCFSFGTQSTLLPVQDGMMHPQRAAEAATYSLVAVTSLYAVVGAGLATLFWQAPDGVEQLILLNLPTPSPIATLVQLTSAAVAILSYPFPLMPVIQLLPALLPAFGQQQPEAKASRRSHGGTSDVGAGARLATLATTTSLALLLQQFGVAASLCGCLNIISSQILPPLCHLRLCVAPALERATARRTLRAAAEDGEATPEGGAWRAVSLRLLWLGDALLVLVGVGAFLYFAVQTMGEVAVAR